MMRANCHHSPEATTIRPTGRLFEHAEPGESGAVRASMLRVRAPAGEVIDLVAWRVNHPTQWWLRRGVAVVLGEAAVDRADWLDLPLVLHSTPERWSRAGANGAAVLDWHAVLPLNKCLRAIGFSPFRLLDP